MGKGRKEIPNQIKDKKGTIRKSRVNTDIPVLPPVGKLPITPVFLNSFGKKVYRTVGKSLLDAGVLTDVNLMMFSALCREYGIYWEAETDMKKITDRWEEIKDKQGNKKTVPSAKHRISKEALQNAKMLSVEFGLTPASISKITALGNSDNKPKLEDLLK